MPHFKFEVGGRFYGQVTDVRLSEPMEGDYGTYQRLIVEVQTTTGDIRTVMLPPGKNWPVGAHKRSILYEWLTRAALVPELEAKFATATRVDEAMNALKGQWLRFDEQEFVIPSFGESEARKRDYLVPTAWYPDGESCRRAAANESIQVEPMQVVQESSVAPSISQDLLERARGAWRGLAAIEDETVRKRAFASMMGEEYSEALYEAVRK